MPYSRWPRILDDGGVQRLGLPGCASADRGVPTGPAYLLRLVRLAAKDFTGGTNPRPATEADYERLFMQAM